MEVVSIKSEQGSFTRFRSINTHSDINPRPFQFHRQTKQNKTFVHPKSIFRHEIDLRKFDMLMRLKAAFRGEAAHEHGSIATDCEAENGFERRCGDKDFLKASTRCFSCSAKCCFN